MKSNCFIIAFCAGLTILISSCKNQTLQIFKSNSARTQYLNTLERSGISSTKIGKEWQNSGGEAIVNASPLEIPVSIQGSFKSKSIEAKAWKIQLEQGASVSIWVHWQARDSSELIVDLLEGENWKELESYVAQNDSVKFEADRSGQYLLRIQPELLATGNFRVRINGTATYAVFPVHGKNSTAIQSVWGDVRDAGRRSHEGVDIFATRGTPVLAPVEGTVTSVRDRGLGGKQVWLRDAARGWNLYFAHLDSQLVNNLQRVQPGDTLGLVGNTGNARTTPPHLHFGIYQSGAINPLPAIITEFEIASDLPIQDLPSIMKVNVPQVNLRALPTAKSEVISQLTANTTVFVLAATSDWFQIQTGDGVSGFLAQRLLSKPDSTPLTNSAAYAFTDMNPFMQDSLLVHLDEFVKVGSTAGFDIIQDQDENVLYLKTN